MPYVEIAPSIASNLGPPEYAIAPRPPEEAAAVPVPETAIDEDDGSIAWKDEVGPTRNAGHVETIPKTKCKQGAPKLEFGLGVPPADAGHDLATLRLGKDVGARLPGHALSE